MLRFATAIFLLLSFSAQTFQQSIIIMGYYINPSSYEKNCVNITRPKLKCHGRCQMMKKLQEEEKKQQQQPERKLENKSEVASSRSFAPALPLVFSSAIIYPRPVNTGEPISAFTSLLRPPIA